MTAERRDLSRERGGGLEQCLRLIVKMEGYLPHTQIFLGRILYVLERDRVLICIERCACVVVSDMRFA